MKHRNKWKKEFLKENVTADFTPVTDNAVLDNLDISYYSDRPVKTYWLGADKQITTTMQTVRVDTLNEFKRKFKRPIVMHRIYEYTNGGFLIHFAEV